MGRTPDRNDRWKAQYNAPAGTFWLCTACGKWSKNRVAVGDVSCFLNSVLLTGEKPEFQMIKPKKKGQPTILVVVNAVVGKPWPGDNNEPGT